MRSLRHPNIVALHEVDALIARQIDAADSYQYYGRKAGVECAVRHDVSLCKCVAPDAAATCGQTGCMRYSTG